MLQGYGQNKSYKSLEEALVGVRKAVQGEREDELFYDYLIAVAPTTEDKEIITSIRNDEQKHNKMFRQIYRDFTGEEITDTDDESFQKPNSFEEGVKKALFGELAAVEKYRDIRAGLPTRYYRDMVFEILTDELKHADKYNYILTITIARKKV
ncbi:ferritin-like domain-containing protein [Pontibacillus yanchengensis]|uniref:Ferritin-like domain-containing protein n=3 Tax=Pontibacillus yanchengensis TaxID=462910 RepID=A0ACC7VAT7_9BACI|nr:ferritin-like domain-containing protein [Pontibacillus yanchengensis]MYL51783.1 ferritin-like domain-containing protein [Pontibacillus yanchengensis]